MIARLDAEIDSEADDGAALGTVERAEQEAQIGADVLAIEREETALIWRAESEGQTIEFRADTSPQALLGVALFAGAVPAQPAVPSFLMSWPVSIGSKRAR